MFGFGCHADIVTAQRHVTTIVPMYFIDLSERPTLRLAGLEKSGAFVEHAAAIQEQVRLGKAYKRTGHLAWEHLEPHLGAWARLPN